MMDINVGLLQWSTKTSGIGIKNKIVSNRILAEELHKPIIRKFNKRKVQSLFIDNIQGTGLPDMKLIIKFNKGFRFLLCVIGICSNYTSIFSSKDKKGTRITNDFKKDFKKI